MTMDHIRLRDVKTNNLKGIDVDIPLGKLTVVTGVSGSGKSSLVFETLYSESYRRYVESLSSFARQYLKALPKPDIGSVENLPPSIAVKQARASGNSRSTVGTMTEVLDLLRILYANFSQIHCPGCGETVTQDDPDSIANKIADQFNESRLLILAPLSHYKKLKPKNLKSQLSGQGFTRVIKSLSQPAIKLEDIADKDLFSSFLVTDRLTADRNDTRRLHEACKTALKIGRETLVVQNDEDQTTKYFTTELKCLRCDKNFAEPSIALFSFNHPFGACTECQGFGAVPAPNWTKIVPDRSSSLNEDGVVLWNFGEHRIFTRRAIESAKTRGMNPGKSFEAYSDQDWHWLEHGDDKKFDGVRGYFKFLDAHKHKTHFRIHAARFRKYVECPVCIGARLNPNSLACRIQTLNISELSDLNVEELIIWIRNLRKKLEESAKQLNKNLNSSHLEKSNEDDFHASGALGWEEALDELQARLFYLQKIGLSYLTLSRQTRTLSGGEQQRINMARCLGSALTSTLYCLDEPSAGLHARDSSNLLEILYELRNQGNTVVVVEHESTIIKGADQTIEIGPEAGHRGGTVVSNTNTKNKILTKSQKIDFNWSHKNFGPNQGWIELQGATTHNLKNINIKIPTESLTVVCGVSGSGKTSLIQHTLYPLLAKALGSDIEGNTAEPKAKSVGPSAVLKRFSQVVHVSQTQLGRSSRSNIATYLGIYDGIRKALAQTPAAKALGLTPGHFSFNTSGGRCETCSGLGKVTEDLSFLGEMDVICPACKGDRFDKSVLSVRLQDKNLSDILRLTIDELRDVFFDDTSMRNILDKIVRMGLGYLTVGQSTSSFSGGEAQRVKLLRLLSLAVSQKPSILIFDEPTTGLSDSDVMQLLKQLRDLTTDGHTVIVVEHHLGVIRSADWLIEVGPEASARGGELVYAGYPKDLSLVSRSVTAPYLN